MLKEIYDIWNENDSISEEVNPMILNVLTENRIHKIIGYFLNPLWDRECIDFNPVLVKNAFFNVLESVCYVMSKLPDMEEDLEGITSRQDFIEMFKSSLAKTESWIKEIDNDKDFIASMSILICSTPEFSGREIYMIDKIAALYIFINHFIPDFTQEQVILEFKNLWQ